MYPTIIFGVALLLSLSYTTGFVKSFVEHVDDDKDYSAIYAILAVIFWSWFYYLVH